MRPETTKVPEKLIGENLHNFGMGNNFLDMEKGTCTKNKNKQKSLH